MLLHEPSRIVVKSLVAGDVLVIAKNHGTPRLYAAGRHNMTLHQEPKSQAVRIMMPHSPPQDMFLYLIPGRNGTRDDILGVGTTPYNTMPFSVFPQGTRFAF